MAAINPVWPTNPEPMKSEIELMYKSAYYVDSSFFRPRDLADFGLDLHRLKEFGEVRMKKSLRQLRKSVRGLWERMNGDQRTLFLMTHLVLGVKYVEDILSDLSRVLGNVDEELRNLDTLKNILFGRIPKGLHVKLMDGLGKEWTCS